MMVLRAWLVAAAVGLTLFVPSGTAHADSGPALDFQGMAPGSIRTGEFSVSNPSSGQATISIATLNLSDDDDGCVRPEVRAGDVSCGDGGGELSQWLDVVIIDGGHELWRGRLAELDEDQRLPGVLEAGQTKDLEITVAMPIEAGNDTQTDSVHFDLRIRTVGVAGEDVNDPEVLGAQASAGGPHLPSSASVPTLIEAGLVGPITSAASILTSNLVIAVFAVLLVLAIGVTLRVLRHGRR